MKRRVLLLVVALLGSLLIAIPDAKACSCMASDPRDMLNTSDGAFSGTYLGREPVDVTDPYADWNYIFETDVVYKGDIGDTVEVRAPENGAGCGLEYGEGSAAALVAYLDGGVWRSDLCRTLPPELLEIAAAPFPDPDAQGPPTFLVGGSFGEVRVMALDKQGRTAGYGYGEGDAFLMSMCPGGERSTEVVGSYSTEVDRFVDVRRISDLSVVSTTTAPGQWLDEFVFPLEAICTSDAGETVVFSRGFASDARYTELTRFDGGETESILRGKATEAALSVEKAFLVKGRKILVVNLDTGATSRLRAFDRRVSHLTITPDGTRLAALLGARSEDGKMIVLRTSDGKVTARRSLAAESRFASLQWVADDALMFSGLTQNSPIYNRRLSVTSHIQDWFPESSVTIDCDLYGVGYGVLAKASVCEGGAPTIEREFFSPVTFSVLKLPVGTEIDAPPQN